MDDIPYQGASVCLQGLVSSFPLGALVALRLLPEHPTPAPPKKSDDIILDPRVQSIVSQFAEVVVEPTGLPPSRQCDHAIPIIPGANPFTVRPYRYPPTLKDEIETQVQHMLSQ